MKWVRPALCALFAVALAAPAARAATFTAQGTSPRDTALAAGEDIADVFATLDDEAGTWSLTVTLQGAPADDETAFVNAVFFPLPSDGACGARPGDALVQLRTRARAGSDVTGAIVSPPRAAQAASRDANAEANAVTLLATDSVLAGVRPGCVTVTISRGRPLDTLAATPFTGTRQPPIGGEPSPTPPPAPPALRFTHADARLAASRSGSVSIGLEPLAAGFTGTVRIDPASGSGRSLGSAAFRAKADKSIVVRVRLTTAARRTLARTGKLSVRLKATARSGATRLTRTARATIRAPQRTRTLTRGE